MNVRRTIQLAITLPVALLLIIALLLGWQIRDLLRHADRVSHTEEVKAEIYEAQKLLIDQESGIRAWILTRDPAFLAPYTSAAAALPPVLDDLERMVGDHPQQQTRVRSLRDRYGAWRESAEEERLDSTPSAPISQRVREDLVTRKGMMDEMRGLAAGMIGEEDRLEAERRSRLDEKIRVVLITSAIVFVIFTILSTTLLRRWINQLDAEFAKSLREQTGARHVAEAMASESVEQSREFERRYLELAARVEERERT